MPDFNLQTVLDQTPNHVNGKHEGPSPADAPKLFDAILAGGAAAIVAIVEALKEIDDGSDYKPRFLLHGLATYVCGPGHDKHRRLMALTLADHLKAKRPGTVKVYLIQTLQLVGDPSVAAAIAAQLHDPLLGDPAAAALVAMGEGGAGPLREALKTAKGRARLTIVQSLGVLSDTASIGAIAEVADSSTDETKVAALSALAAIGDAESVDRLLKAADQAKGFARDKSTQACLVLAENLAAGGHIADAKRVYEHLKNNRTTPGEKFIREAAERGLKAVG